MPILSYAAHLQLPENRPNSSKLCPEQSHNILHHCTLYYTISYNMIQSKGTHISLRSTRAPTTHANLTWAHRTSHLLSSKVWMWSSCILAILFLPPPSRGWSSLYVQICSLSFISSLTGPHHRGDILSPRELALTWL